MAELSRHGSDVGSVFDLLGEDENDLTSALGFVLARSPRFREAIIHRISPTGNLHSGGDTNVALEVRGEKGRTDLELHLGEALFVFEAKRDWLLPSGDQLARYADRISSSSGVGALVSLSQASHALAAQYLPMQVTGVPVVHLPWSDVISDLADVAPGVRGRERTWLDELHAYLKKVVRMRSVADGCTYCVVLNDERPAGGASFKEFVCEQLVYFHPYGISGWPTIPPNFMAFRWDGAVRRIHRVIHHDVLPTLAERWPYMASNPAAMRPHAVYDLGPQLPPKEPILNGANYRASRLWVLLDQLQTADTLSDAIAGTRALEARCGNA